MLIFIFLFLEDLDSIMIRFGRWSYDRFSRKFPQIGLSSVFINMLSTRDGLHESTILDGSVIQGCKLLTSIEFRK